MKSRLAFTLALLALVAPLAASAAETAAPAMTPDKESFLAVWDEAGKKIHDLAVAIPADKYGWRPGEGVRSVGEVVGHIAGGVYYLTLVMGVKPPAGYPQSFTEADALEKLAKDDAVAAADRALAYGRQLAVAATPEQLDKQVDFFGQKVTGRTVFLFLEGHCQEHLGQLIAYARMNGVVPPWSRKPEQKN